MVGHFLIGFVLLAPVIVGATTQQIHDVDFNNFEYPWRRSHIPSSWHWLEPIPQSHVRLQNGHLTLDPTDPSHSAYLQLQSVTYGDLDGDRQDEAVVDLLYGSGGTANWHYLYIFKSVNEIGVPIGILESGSRAFGGLVSVSVSQGLVVLDFADEERREGDCCSRGVIRIG